MKTLTMIGIAVVLVLSGAGLSLAQMDNGKPGVALGAIQSFTGKITAIDYEKRTATLESADGVSTPITVDERARNFNQAKVGDIVTIDYEGSVALFVRKTDEAPSASSAGVVNRTALGEKPGGTIYASAEITGAVVDVDYENRILTVKGPEGNIRSFNVGDEVQRLNEIHKGDQIVLQYAETLAVNVHTPVN